MNVLDFPLYYISFQPSEEIENHYRSHGFTNINHFDAVNGRKMSLRRLLNEKIISIQSYEDVIFGRESHKGLPSKGAIGCTLSHYELWELCVEKKYPYIIIAEEDNRLAKKLSAKDLYKIELAITKPNGIFLSSTKMSKRKGKLYFFGTHFYIASLSACKKLIEKAFPIDVQTDWYMGHLSRIGAVAIEGYPISAQESTLFESSIQNGICIKCSLPKSNWFYIGIGVLVIVLIIIVVVLSIKWRKCLTYAHG